MMNGYKYEFDSNDVGRFANFVNIDAKKKGDELAFLYCPYCRGGKHRDKFTFSISLSNGKYKCQRSSCSVQGNMLTLARDFNFELSEDVSAYYNMNGHNNKYRKFKDAAKKIETKNEAVEYLNSRGISEETVKKYEITMKDGQEGILVFPFKDENGELQFIKYRNTKYEKGKSYGAKEWCEKDCKPILFGMNHCDIDFKTLVVTEGQIDSLTLAECGVPNAVSVPTGKNGFTWIPHCWDFVQQFEKIIVFGDYENGSVTLLDELQKRFKKKTYHVRFDDYRDCKDANELYQKYGQKHILDCIKRAIPLPIKNVIRLADVEHVDIYSLDKLHTGFVNLDKLLRGGIPFGGVTLVSGKPGEGKSTLASQLLLQAVNQNYKCFAYSGELPNYIFKEWMNFQVAGMRGVEEVDYKDGKGYEISADVREKIDSFYGDMIYLYDNSAIDDETEEQETLCQMIENAVLQYGVQVVLIDNLMTALDAEKIVGADKYDVQSKFVKRLTRIALRHNILILLVAHKRKNNYSTNENDEISGSGDISNLATVTISYGKDPDEPNSRLLKVSKNRLFGNVNPAGWRMCYSEKCRRIYPEGGSCDFQFNIGTVAEDVAEEENPFL